MVMLEHFYKGVRHAELRLPCGDEPHPEQELPGGASQVCNLIKHYFSMYYVSGTGRWGITGILFQMLLFSGLW